MKIFIFLFFAGILSHAQWDSVSIVMEDGSSKQGRTFILDEEQRLFKLKALSGIGEVEILDGKNVKSLEYNLSNGKVKFIKILTYKDKKNLKLNKEKSIVRILYSGENINLYSGYKPDFTNNIATNKILKINYYVQRPNEKAASLISIEFPEKKQQNSDIFYENSVNYFNDYPDLRDKIKNQTFSSDELYKIVKLYDDWKSGK